MRLAVLILALAVSTLAIAVTDNMKKIMGILGFSLDGAETSLRVVLNKPANGGRFTPQEVSCERKLDASLRLLNFEQRFPGYLQGKHGSSRWDQYYGVVVLHDQLSNKYQFYYPEMEDTVPSRKNRAVR